MVKFVAFCSRFDLLSCHRFAQGWTVQLHAIAVVDEAIENGVGKRWFANLRTGAKALVEHHSQLLFEPLDLFLGFGTPMIASRPPTMAFKATGAVELKWVCSVNQHQSVSPVGGAIEPGVAACRRAVDPIDWGN